MNRTSDYLQSDYTAEKGIEIGVLVNHILADAIHEAGLPAGAFNVVSGHGSTAGSALVRHPGVDKISFTGSTAVGQRLMRDAAAAGGTVQNGDVMFLEESAVAFHLWTGQEAPMDLLRSTLEAARDASVGPVAAPIEA